MKKFSISDSQDTFSVEGNELVLRLQGRAEEHRIAHRDELRAYLHMVAQMFIDHEGRFEEVDAQLCAEVAPFFYQLVDRVSE